MYDHTSNPHTPESQFQWSNQANFPYLILSVVLPSSKNFQITSKCSAGAMMWLETEKHHAMS